MIHPLLTRLATQPGLFAEHAGAYAELAAAELAMAGRQWVKRGLLLMVATTTAALALGLGGVAVLLAAALPQEQMPAPWALWAVPLLPALVAAACAWRAQVAAAAAPFEQLRQELDADVRLLREVDAS